MTLGSGTSTLGGAQTSQIGIVGITATASPQGEFLQRNAGATASQAITQDHVRPRPLRS